MKSERVTQLCPTLWDPMDCSLPGSVIHGIFQARTIPFCRGSSQPREWTQISCIAGRFFYHLSHQESWNIRYDTIKFLEQNTDNTFSDINHSSVFLDPKAIEIKAKINKWDLVKFISFCVAEETINKTKWQPMDGDTFEQGFNFQNIQVAHIT